MWSAWMSREIREPACARQRKQKEDATPRRPASLSALSILRGALVADLRDSNSHHGGHLMQCQLVSTHVVHTV